jgi:cytochrome c553
MQTAYSYQEIDLMKKVLLVTLVIFAAATFAMAQIGVPNGDVLGAHLNYGRGCAACHAPHSGAYGNGNAKTADPTSGNVALWGQDVASLVGTTLTFGGTGPGTGYSETLPGFTTTNPDLNITLCLSCHDGNIAKGAMMKNAVYETLPAGYGTWNTIPTLLGSDGTTTGNYLNDHPVGLNAAISCGGQYNWDCTIVNGAITYPAGTKMYQFVQNYGFFVSPGNLNKTTPIVTCTTCHNQHLMNIVSVTQGSKSGLPTGYYKTMFFVRAPYNPASGTAGSNQTAQFCRECHGGEANEMNGGSAIPTTF